MSQRDRVRRVRAKSRDGYGEEQKVTPCTEFDKAYFNSYAHVGIHEEMIKVSENDVILIKMYLLS
jgi:protein arginine N-methyltransferase 6